MSVEDENKLFVAGLADAVTEDVLRQLFEATGGEVVSVTIPLDRSTGKARGFGFVTMGSPEQAHSARESLDGSLQAGRSISVRLFRSDRGSPPPSRGGNYHQPEESTLYVRNLPFDATVAEIEELFGEMGVDDIQRVHLPTDAEGRFRGFGFVMLGSAQTAQAAASQMQHAAIRGRTLSVSVARARGAGAGRPPRPSGPPSASGSYASRGSGTMPATRPPVSREFRSEPEPVPFESGPPPSSLGGTGRGPRRDRDKDRERKKDKKRKVKLQVDAPKRRQNEGFRAPRQRAAEDWDED